MAENPGGFTELDKLVQRFDNLEPKSKHTQSCPDLQPKIAAARNLRKTYVSSASGATNNEENPVESVNGLSSKKFDPVIYISAESVIKEFQTMKAAQTSSPKESINKPVDDKPKSSPNGHPNPKALKEKSASSANIKLGPFATIRENELKRKQKRSLDLEQTEEE